MADLNVKEIPDDVLRAFKVLCYAKGYTMKDELIRFMRASVKEETLDLVRAKTDEAAGLFRD